ncbi:extracellular solute-binding protein [Xanthobacter sp. KR7-225]|uniref:ABC transporter substrate-binding protein n=1 Tax=Xanthobacter sp. KR7-225 TaxID=3156613 RepID=UPI0032B3EED2
MNAAWIPILLGLMSLVLDPAGAAATDEALTYEQVLEGARREGHLVNWVQLPTKPETHRALADAFNARFGLNTIFDWTPTSPNTANPRVIAEVAGGRTSSVDIIGGAIDEVAQLVEARAVRPFPWTAVFGEKFPGIGALEEQLAPEYRGTALPYLDVYYGLIWNPAAIADADVPSKLSDLVAGKWRGKFALNSIFLVPLPILAPKLGSDAVMALAQGIYRNEPVLIRGTPAVAESVVNGATAFGITNSTSAEAAARVGRPIKFRLFSDFVPISAVHLYVPDHAPNPYTARLFAAWFATEGYKIADRYEPNPQSRDEAGKFMQMARAATAEGAAVVRILTPDDLKAAAVVRQKIGLMLGGQN